MDFTGKTFNWATSPISRSSEDMATSASIKKAEGCDECGRDRLALAHPHHPLGVVMRATARAMRGIDRHGVPRVGLPRMLQVFDNQPKMGPGCRACVALEFSEGVERRPQLRVLGES